MTEEQEENDEEADRTSSGGEPKAVCSRQRKGSRQFSRLSLAADWGSGLGSGLGRGFRQQREERVPSTNPGSTIPVGGAGSEPTAGPRREMRAEV